MVIAIDHQAFVQDGAQAKDISIRRGVLQGKKFSDEHEKQSPIGRHLPPSKVCISLAALTPSFSCDAACYFIGRPCILVAQAVRSTRPIPGY